MKTRVKYQSFSHWFSYNWRFVVIAVFFIAVGLYYGLIVEHEPDPDYTINWIGTTMLSTSEEEALESTFTALASDQNGDGLVTVSIVQYTINFHYGEDATDTDMEESYMNLQKLLTRLQMKDSYIFLMDDPEGLQTSTGILRYLDGGYAGEENDFEAENWEEMCVLWSCDGFERTAYLGRRALFEEDSDYEETFPGGEALFQALIAAS
ncbi:MAG: hypothetical protein LIO45_02510 [Clostridiales bacterium]|nr:hypothetical protein [Clostridiales bacterium]